MKSVSHANWQCVHVCMQADDLRQLQAALTEQAAVLKNISGLAQEVC